MTESGCIHESAVLRAAHTGQWQPELRRHTQTCAACAEVLRLHAQLTLLRAGDQPTPAPDPTRLWLKAQFAERQRRSLLIARISGFAYTALFAGIGIGLYPLIGRKLAQSGGSLPGALGWLVTDNPTLPILAALILLWYALSAQPHRAR
ncbi:MAG TPA: hypothetical protein VNN55_11220 [bacterium]|nr:hypothetical protein [bacterium]